MITVNPRVQETLFQVGRTSNIGDIHTTGDFYTQNIHDNTFGIIARTNVWVTDASNNTNVYRGHVRITATAIRRIDGSTLHLGTARFYIDSNADIASRVPLEADTAWLSWVNAGSLQGATNLGLHKYLRGSLVDPNAYIQFYKWEFVRRELDPVHNVPFLNDYALDIEFKIDFLHRKVNRSNQTNIIRIVPNIEINTTSSANVVYRPVTDTFGTTPNLALRFNRPSVERPQSLYINNNSTNDYCILGVYSNETGAIGSSRVIKFSEMIKADGYNKHPQSLDWLRRMRISRNPSITNSGFPTGSFQVDEQDTIAGGPVLYHQTGWDGSFSNTREIGWTTLENGGSTKGFFPIGAGPIYNSASTITGYPVVSATNPMGRINMLLNGSGSSQTTPLVLAIDQSVRVNGRPPIWSLVNNVRQIIFNNGTYTTPSYNKGFRFRDYALPASAPPDDAAYKYPHNNAGLDNSFKNAILNDAIEGDDGWIYMVLTQATPTTAQQNRRFVRMKYTGPSNPDINDIWDWDNWTGESLAEWTSTLITGVIEPIVTNTTYKLGTMPFIMFPTQAIEPTKLVNGYPTFWGWCRNKLCRVTHNGGTNINTALNWDVEILAGSANTTSNVIIEGTAFTACFASISSNFIGNRRQIVDNWLYFTMPLNHTVLGRVNIEPTDTDYLKLEALSNDLTSLDQTRF